MKTAKMWRDEQEKAGKFEREFGTGKEPMEEKSSL